MHIAMVMAKESLIYEMTTCMLNGGTNAHVHMHTMPPMHASGYVLKGEA